MGLGNRNGDIRRLGVALRRGLFADGILARLDLGDGCAAFIGGEGGLPICIRLIYAVFYFD